MLALSVYSLPSSFMQFNVAISACGPISPLLLSPSTFSKSLATGKCHLRMQQKNLQSLKLITVDLPVATLISFSPSQEPNTAGTDAVFATILPAIC
jgi:hypothetical protein